MTGIIAIAIAIAIIGGMELICIGVKTDSVMFRAIGITGIFFGFTTGITISIVKALG